MAVQGVQNDFSETHECSFHGVPYLLTVSTINGDTMSIEVEQKSDASRWRGDFTSRYIEDITSKTGNFKKFSVFVKMLLSAVKAASESVFVDLLTYQDLEVLKQRKAGGAAQSAGAAKPAASSNKRYLILTYAAEFDRVHYPLPLLYEENPDPQHLKNIIAQLRAEVEALSLDQGGAGRRAGPSGSDAAAELRRMREENTALRQQLKQLDRAVRSDLPDSDRATAEARELGRELKAVRKERDLLLSRVEAIEVDLERERGLQRRELRRKAKELQEALDELGRSREQVRELKLHIRQLQDDLDSAAQRQMSSADRIRAAYAPRPEYGRPYSSGRSGSRGPAIPLSSSGRRDTGASRGRDTSSRERGPSPGSRPNSAPASRSGPRFDPTEYVRQQKERMERRSSGGGSSRNPTPPRSTASSARGSPAGSRPTSAERERPAARGYSPVGSRPGSSERARPRPVGPGDRGWAPAMDVHNKSRASSPATSTTSAPRRPAWGQSETGGGWSKFPPISGNAGTGPSGRVGGAGSRPGSRPQSAERAQSPGRALQEVKKKLSEFVTKRSSTSEDMAGSLASASSSRAVGVGSQQPSAGVVAGGAAGTSALPRTNSKSALFEDASAEIADIDTRLHALQNFLRMAKGAGGSSIASGSGVQ